MFGEFMMSLELSSAEAGWKQVRVAGGEGGSEKGVVEGATEEREEWSVATLFEKKVAKD